MDKIKEMIKRHEGFRKHVYQDTEGLWTIGYGRMIDKSLDGGITREEADFLFENDLSTAIIEAMTIPCYQYLNEARQGVLLDMLFNMGMTRLMGFKKMFAALDARNYEGAAREMINSRWYGQVGTRALDLVEIMRTGKFPEAS